MRKKLKRYKLPFRETLENKDGVAWVHIATNPLEKDLNQ
jgi:hypothetical protein